MVSVIELAVISAEVCPLFAGVTAVSSTVVKVMLPLSGCTVQPGLPTPESSKISKPEFTMGDCKVQGSEVPVGVSPVKVRFVVAVALPCPPGKMPMLAGV